jgi:hypothetical protein
MRRAILHAALVHAHVKTFGLYDHHQVLTLLFWGNCRAHLRLSVRCHAYAAVFVCDGALF